jgi:hypothetical protein
MARRDKEISRSGRSLIRRRAARLGGQRLSTSGGKRRRRGMLPRSGLIYGDFDSCSDVAPQGLGRRGSACRRGGIRRRI